MNTITGFSVLDEAIAAVDAKKKREDERKTATGRKPPSEGKCKRCGENRPLNRKFICYQCYVWTNLEDWGRQTGLGWKVGDPHPDSCQCTLPEHKRKSTGN